MKENQKKQLVAILLVLVAGLIARFLLIAKGPIHLIKCWIMIDDAFYSLKIAKNIALGAGITCDGVHPTNAFQPLYILIMVPVFYFLRDNLLTPVTIALAITSIFNLLTGLIIYAIVKRFTGFLSAFFSLFLWSFSISVIKFGLNGLETSISAFFLTLSIYFYILRIQGKNDYLLKDCIIFGIILGLALLSRFDVIFFITALIIDHLIIKLKEKDLSLQSSLNLIISISISILMIAPVLVRSAIVFNTIIPLSGKAARIISLYNGVRPYFTLLQQPPQYFPIESPPFAFYLEHVKGSLMVLKENAFFINPIESLATIISLGFKKFNFHIDRGPITIFFLTIILIMFALNYRRKLFNVNATPFRKESPFRFNFLIYFTIILFGNYTFYMFGQWHYFRYFFPTCIVFVIFSGLIFHRVIEKFLEVIKTKYFMRIIILIIIFSYYLLLSAFGKTYDHKGYITYAKSEFLSSFYYDTALWIRNNLPISCRIGGFESGIVGYFAPKHKIINLDGPQNKKAVEALERQKMMDYIRSEKIDYIFGQGIIINNLLKRASTPPLQKNELKLIVATGDTQGPRMLIFKVIQY